MSVIEGFYYYYHGFGTILEYIMDNGEIPFYEAILTSGADGIVQSPGITYINYTNGNIYDGTTLIGTLGLKAIVQDPHADLSYYYLTEYQGHEYLVTPIDEIIYENGQIVQGSIPTGDTGTVSESPVSDVQLSTLSSASVTEVSSAETGDKIGFIPPSNQRGKEYQLEVRDGKYFFDFRLLDSEIQLVITRLNKVWVYNLKRR